MKWMFGKETYQARLGLQFSIPDVTSCVRMFLSWQLEPSCVSLSLPLFVTAYLFLFGTHSLCGAEACHLVQLLPVLRLASVMKIFAQSFTYWDAGGEKKHKLGSYFLSILMRKQCITGYCTILRPSHSISYTLLHFTY